MTIPCLKLQDFLLPDIPLIPLFVTSLAQGSPLALAFFGSDKEDPVDRTKQILREADAVFFDVDSPLAKQGWQLC